MSNEVMTVSETTAQEPDVFGICKANCKWPVYTKNQILSILQQMIDAGSLQGIDPTESPIVALIREKRANGNVSFWVGTEAQFNAISPAVSASLVMARIDADGNIYLCTDDTTFADWKAEIVAAAESIANQVVNGKQALHKTATVTLPTSGWSSSAITVSVEGVEENNTVIVAPAPDSYDNFTKAGIVCTAQGLGTLTFTYKKALAAAVTVNVVILGV